MTDDVDAALKLAEIRKNSKSDYRAYLWVRFLEVGFGVLRSHGGVIATAVALIVVALSGDAVDLVTSVWDRAAQLELVGALGLGTGVAGAIGTVLCKRHSNRQRGVLQDRVEELEEKNLQLRAGNS